MTFVRKSPNLSKVGGWAVKKTLMRAYIHPAGAGMIISAWRGGGLTISTQAFGDASNKIFSKTCPHAFRIFIDNIPVIEGAQLWERVLEKC